MKLIRTACPFAAALFFAGCAIFRPTAEDPVRAFPRAVEARAVPFPLPVGSRVDSISVNLADRRIVIRLNKEFSYGALRPENVRRMYASVDSFFRDSYPGFTCSVQSLGRPIEDLIPNYYRTDIAQYDFSRMPRPDLRRPEPVVFNVSRNLMPAAGLYNRTVALWHSHGWYYNNREDRWEWQRPRLFQTVEDRVPMSFTLPYLIPMLENAGATVFVPRERDTQVNEVVVDNDTPGVRYLENSTRRSVSWRTGEGKGFAIGTPPYREGDNPFLTGTQRVILSDTTAQATATWIPEIPETGEYAVSIAYVSSRDNVEDARYVVYHAGGRTEFLVNQQIGGGTWITLGTFRFRAGVHPENGRVVLSNRSRAPGRILSADAVRFGGGRGTVMRGGRTSGRPKFLEGARYFLQYAGMPDTLVYNLNRNENDYRDDYQSRPEYVNYLVGAPFGPNRNRQIPGLGIPVDVSLAFHTDAGITHNDTTVGTLAIYSIEGADTLAVFPDGMSRFANRDLADLVQTQIVQDLRARWDPAWSRRQLRNADYSESVRPNVPSVLLELLSHQNFLDMKYMLDPRFRFDAARAIYKGILRFIATQQRTPAVVQPLPVTHLAAEFTGQNAVTLRWRPQEDPLEPGAQAERYMLYTRLEDGGFDNGRIIRDTIANVTDLPLGTITSFKVTALNAGGESFPSEVISVCRAREQGDPALIINGFHRIAGPGTVETPSFAGFLGDFDLGVADGKDFSFVGRQHDFDPGSAFRTNDAPGHGASDADAETMLAAGNTFDYPFIHGAALRANGMSFVSCSDEAVADSLVIPSRYRFVDLVLGKQRATRWQRPLIDSIRGLPFPTLPTRMRAAIEGLTHTGGRLFVSGSYVGTDLFGNAGRDSTAPLFGRKILHFTWVTGHAARTGVVMSADSFFLPRALRLTFNTKLSPEMYAVESPDAVGPADSSTTLLRYAENEFSAAVGYRGAYGVVVAGFPFETITGADQRAAMMRAVLRWLGEGISR